MKSLTTLILIIFFLYQIESKENDEEAKDSSFKFDNWYNAEKVVLNYAMLNEIIRTENLFLNFPTKLARNPNIEIENTNILDIKTENNEINQDQNVGHILFDEVTQKALHFLCAQITNNDKVFDRFKVWLIEKKKIWLLCQCFWKRKILQCIGWNLRD